MEFVTSIFAYMRRTRDYRRTVNSLHGLDDRILRDIGVRRDEIESVAFRLYDENRRHHEARAQSRHGEQARNAGFGGRELAAQH